MNREQMTDKDKKVFIDCIKKSKTFTSEEKSEIVQELQNADTLEEIDYVFENSKHRDKLQEVLSKLNMKVIIKTLNFLEDISTNPIYHPVAMEHSVKYQKYYNLLSEELKKKLACRRDVMYYWAKGHTYILLFIAYFYTLGIAFIIRRIYINNKRKKFIEYLNTNDFNELIDLAIDVCEKWGLNK